MTPQKELKIKTLLTIGLWIPALFLLSSLIDNHFICNQFYDDDESDNLNRCFDGESQFAFVLIGGIFFIMSLSATHRVYVIQKENKKENNK